MSKKSKTKFGMLSVNAGIDNNPNPTQADRIAGATKKFKKGGLAGRLAQRGYGKAKKWKIKVQKWLGIDKPVLTTNQIGNQCIV